jgi:hypothetical protein
MLITRPEQSHRSYMFSCPVFAPTHLSIQFSLKPLATRARWHCMHGVGIKLVKCTNWYGGRVKMEDMADASSSFQSSTVPVGSPGPVTSYLKQRIANSGLREEANTIRRSWSRCTTLYANSREYTLVIVSSNKRTRRAATKINLSLLNLKSSFIRVFVWCTSGFLLALRV